MRTGRATIPPDATHPLQHDAWFAGFVAGEGCFFIGRDRREPYGTYFVPALKIALRDDDVAVLYEIQAAFGGRIEEHHINRAMSQRGFNAQPQARWTTGGKVVLAGLVAYFDRFPLRAKKGDDFEIWREAVMVYVEDGGKAAGLEDLKVRLESQRVYRAPLAAVS